MLKTSNTESAEPRKRVVEVGGGGRNRAESDGKHKVMGLMMVVVTVVISTRSFIQGFSTVAAPLTSMLKTSSLTDSSTNAT